MCYCIAQATRINALYSDTPPHTHPKKKKNQCFFYWVSMKNAHKKKHYIYISYTLKDS